MKLGTTLKQRPSLRCSLANGQNFWTGLDRTGRSAVSDYFFSCKKLFLLFFFKKNLKKEIETPRHHRVITVSSPCKFVKNLTEVKNEILSPLQSKVSRCSNEVYQMWNVSWRVS